jgi:hypothetical protein
VIAERVTQLPGHEAGVAGGGEQMFEASETRTQPLVCSRIWCVSNHSGGLGRKPNATTTASAGITRRVRGAVFEGICQVSAGERLFRASLLAVSFAEFFGSSHHFT